MKTLSTLIAMLLSFTLSAQERNDNTIIIITEQSYDDAFRTMGRTMVANGFTIDNADRDFGTITTQEVRVGSPRDPVWELKVTALIGDSEIILTGQVRQPGIYEGSDRDSWRPMHLAGRIKMMYKAWQRAVELAEAFPNGEIRYEQR